MTDCSARTMLPVFFAFLFDIIMQFKDITVCGKNCEPNIGLFLTYGDMLVPEFKGGGDYLWNRMGCHTVNKGHGGRCHSVQ
jgi:hypothetical protein